MDEQDTRGMALPSKGEIRAARKMARAEGAVAEALPNGGFVMVKPRTRRAERRHQRGMDRWARCYDQRNGAPEDDDDR